MIRMKVSLVNFKSVHLLETLPFWLFLGQCAEPETLKRSGGVRNVTSRDLIDDSLNSSILLEVPEPHTVREGG